MTLRKTFRLVIGLLTLLTLAWTTLLLRGFYGIDDLPVHKKENHLRILSMNVSAGNVLDDSFQNKILNAQPDIIVIIEWTGNNVNLLKFTDVGYLIALNHPRKKVHGLCILSKPSGFATIIESPVQTPCTLPLGQFRFSWKGQDISLFAIHAPPPVPACKRTTDDYLSAVADWIQGGKLNQNIGTGNKGDVVLIAGDFNSIAFDEGIENLKSKGLQDAYTKYDFTAQTWKPFAWSPYVAKIDYILFADPFKSVGRFRFGIPDSDHLGIITDLKL